MARRSSASAAGVIEVVGEGLPAPGAPRCSPGRGRPCAEKVEHGASSRRWRSGGARAWDNHSNRIGCTPHPRSARGAERQGGTAHSPPREMMKKRWAERQARLISLRSAPAPLDGALSTRSAAVTSSTAMPSDLKIVTSASARAAWRAAQRRARRARRRCATRRRTRLRRSADDESPGFDERRGSRIHEEPPRRDERRGHLPLIGAAARRPRTTCAPGRSTRLDTGVGDDVTSTMRSAPPRTACAPRCRVATRSAPRVAAISSTNARRLAVVGDQTRTSASVRTWHTPRGGCAPARRCR